MAGFATDKNRHKKWMKINRVIADAIELPEVRGFKILDIGCGNGEIAFGFSGENDVYCVDVADQINVDFRTSVRFRVIEDEQLPFENESFDVVVSNHVVEHMTDSQTHIAEVKRILKKGGICYFASPNRLFPVEPHYKVPLIHYLPDSWFHQLLKWFKLYREDLRLLSFFKMKKLFMDHGFSVRDVVPDILTDPAGFHLEIKITRAVPVFVWRFLSFISPTSIFILKKRTED